MGFKIITADERLKESNGIKGVIFGVSKIGKTSLLWTLDSKTTLFVDLEAGGLSVKDWKGDSIELRTWEDARNLAAFIGGPNPALREDQSYSQAHYDHIIKEYGDPTSLAKYKTIFIDSITVAGRLCFNWAKGQPQSFSEKTGKPNMLGTYGLHGQEMIGWLTHLQHTKNKNIWFVGLLDKKVDDFKRVQWEPQIEGAKTGLELPGIVDEVISMVEMTKEDGETYRAFVCQTPNSWGYPAGDRSGKLDVIEQPHLGRLMEKIKTGPKRNPAEYDYDLKTQKEESTDE
jgi:hypothetical protein